MKMMGTTPASLLMISVSPNRFLCRLNISSSEMFTDGQVKERGCSTKHNICDDLDSSETACKKPRHFLKSIFISNPFQTGSRSPGDAEIKRKSR